MEIHAGEGGTDSKIFVHELFAAYTKYAENNGLESEILDSADGKVCAKITGTDASKFFEHESGGHVIQRIPPTERDGRRQTSVVSVAVLPMPPDNKLVLLPESEIEVSYTMGQGAGGQHKQRTYSCVQMVHKATGLTARIDGRDQHSNKREAHRILSARVHQQLAGKTQDEYNKLRKERLGTGGRGAKIRTYNLIQSRCVDHRTGKKTGKVKDVLERGRFELLLS